MSKMISFTVALAAAVGLQTAAHAAGGYTFTKLVDHHLSPRTTPIRRRPLSTA